METPKKVSDESKDEAGLVSRHKYPLSDSIIGYRRSRTRRSQELQIKDDIFLESLSKIDSSDSEVEASHSSDEAIEDHSLASVELGSWAAQRSTRRCSNLPFCTAPLSPTEAVSRTDVLQRISSAIIHLFQKRPLKEDELGKVQGHVRYLVNSEAGGLVHEYFKDQLLRKGMIILREKIKNEEGLDLLRMLGDTWNYFFREILPTIQAMMHPLTGLLAKEEESVRSLTLLAFRNIVVLRVHTKEALDSVKKKYYPSSIQHMLLILQNVQDNVFLSENQFLLEKLLARVVNPYLGQRGLYEGEPHPVIKIKLKATPIDTFVRANQRPCTALMTRVVEEELSPPVATDANSNSLLSSFVDKKNVGFKRLKPVLEHAESARRHSVVS